MRHTMSTQGEESSRYSLLATALALRTLAVIAAFCGVALAQVNHSYVVDEMFYDRQLVAYQGSSIEAIRVSGTSWVQLEFTDSALSPGDVLRIRSRDGDQQVFRHDDPQISDPLLGGRLVSAIFNGGHLEVELVAAPGNPGARATIANVRTGTFVGVMESICGVDDRVALVDPCIVRVRNANGAFGTGFMISDHWMLTARHVLVMAPLTIERNVPGSNPVSGALTPSVAADQFTVPVLNAANHRKSAGTNFGNDWAVVHVPTNTANNVPGAGCTPTFDCTFSNMTFNVPLSVAGYGTDTELAKNGTLQVDTGPTVGGSLSNAYDFFYRADTQNGTSGGPIKDAQGRIVGIHKGGDCNAVGSGANWGTLISNPGLQLAIKALCGENPCSTDEVATFCTGKTTSLGCVPFATTDGFPSASVADPFAIRARDVVPDEAGFLIYGFAKSNLNFHGGKLCVKSPFQRLPAKIAKSSGPPPCAGVLSRNFNQRIQSGLDPALTPGRQVRAQWRQRDPSEPQGFGDNLSDGVHFTIHP